MKWPILCSLCPSISGIPRRPKVLSILVSSAGLLILPIVGAYPHPDVQVVGLLTENFSSPIQTPEDRLELQAQELTIRYYMFFKHLFDTVREQVEVLDGTNLLQAWNSYLSGDANDGKSNRDVLYQAVVDRVNCDNTHREAKEVCSRRFCEEINRWS